MITKHAPAKLNLNLHITGKLEHGYHSLQSLVAFVDITDTLTLTDYTPDGVHSTQHYYEDIELTLSTHTPFDLDDAFFTNNLIHNAARTLYDHAKEYAPHKPRPVHIALEKHIPIGAGLGGGSSDAAATLSALNDYWQLQLSHEQLRSYASKLGSDIAACIQPKATWMSATGNTLTPAQITADLWAVLIHPRIPLSAGSVYQSYDQSNHQPLPEFSTFQCQRASTLLDYLNQTHNHLTSAAISHVQDIEVILNALRHLPNVQLARMTGSGSACFGLFTSHSQAMAAANHLKTNHPNWWVKSAKLMF